MKVPVDVTVHPVREAVRCLLVDQAGRALLARDDLQVGPWIGRRWWSSEQLRVSGAVVIPRALPGLLERIARGDLPDPDEDLGV